MKGFNSPLHSGELVNGKFIKSLVIDQFYHADTEEGLYL